VHFGLTHAIGMTFACMDIPYNTFTRIEKIMEFVIATMYILMIVITLVVRRSLKLRSYHAMHNMNTRSAKRIQNAFK
jgi:cell division protein FtsL